jgi:hypothetical protein
MWDFVVDKVALGQVFSATLHSTTILIYHLGFVQ